MRRVRRGFTLTELLVVVGLIAILISLLLPVLNKTRTAARSANCLSNLRQLGLGLTMYLSAHRGRLPEWIPHNPATPELAWNGYWLGLLAQESINDRVLLCPAAYEPLDIPSNHGLGDATHAWTGKYLSKGSEIHLSDALFRVGSYGYNRYLTAGQTGRNEGQSNITVFHNISNVPAFLDCTYADVRPEHGLDAPVIPPPNLLGNEPANSPQHWRFLIARHGRGINVCMADGSAAWVPLEDTYTLSWSTDWVPCTLTNLPVN